MGRFFEAVKAGVRGFILICAECGRIEWYATEPETIGQGAA